MQTLNKIGFIDSGIGGLNVLNACANQVKNAKLIYLGDNKNTPYGNKNYSFLKKRLDYMLKTLIDLEVKTVVIACNTLSVYLGENCLNNYDLNFIKTTPFLPKNYKNPTLIATPITANSEFVKNLYKKGSVLPLPFLAKEIEDNIFNLTNVKLQKDLKGLPKNTDSIVLGCTHYLFVKSEIEKLSNLPVLSNADIVSKNLCNFLKGQKLDCLNNLENDNKNEIEFIGNSALYNKKVYQTFFSNSLKQL